MELERKGQEGDTQKDGLHTRYPMDMGQVGIVMARLLDSEGQDNLVMQNHNIRFEKVGDISLTYPFLEVYVNGSQTPSLDIGVSEDREIVFTIYPTDVTTSITFSQWEYILNEAKTFLIEALRDEDGFKEWMREITKG